MTIEAAAPSELAFGVAFAGCAVFVATLPLAASRGVPAIVRGALALAIAPMAANSLPLAGLDAISQAGANMAVGAVVGLSTAVISGAAAAAGGLLDTAIGAPPAGLDRVFGQNAGPFAVLVPLMFAVALCSSGGLTTLIAGFVAACSVAARVHLTGVSALGNLIFATAVAIALPALGAHAIATFIAGFTARVVPRINGMLLAPGVGFGLALLVATAGVPALLLAISHLAHLAARVPRFM